MRNIKTLIEEAKTFSDPGFVMGAPWVTTTYIQELVNALGEMSQKLDERNRETAAEIGLRAIKEINRAAREEFGYFVDITDNNPNAFKIAVYAAHLALESQENS